MRDDFKQCRGSAHFPDESGVCPCGLTWQTNGIGVPVGYLQGSKHLGVGVMSTAQVYPDAASKPSSSEVRKNSPVFSGVLQYFPDALMAVSQHSKRGNDKHNPGQPMHWAREKSTDHADCLGRHLIDIGPNWDKLDPETGSYHAAALAWRALALLQTLLERSK